MKPPSTESSDAGILRLLKDGWLCFALLVMLILYVWLVLIRPTGENWGRGWNLFAFLIYSAPTALLAVGLALWRRGKTEGLVRKVAGFVALSGVVFPIVCLMALRAKL